jgi:hypothetical protein
MIPSTVNMSKLTFACTISFHFNWDSGFVMPLQSPAIKAFKIEYRFFLRQILATLLIKSTLNRPSSNFLSEPGHNFGYV